MEEQNINRRPIAKRSEETEIIAMLLHDLKPGDVISYDDLSKAIAKDIRKLARPALYSARRILLNEEGIVFDCVRKVGVKRLTDVENVSITGAQGISRIRSCTRRTKKRLRAVAEFEALPPELRVRHNMHMTVLSFVDGSTNHWNIKRLEPAVIKAHAALSLKQTLELFLENGT